MATPTTPSAIASSGSETFPATVLEPVSSSSSKTSSGNNLNNLSLSTSKLAITFFAALGGLMVGAATYLATLKFTELTLAAAATLGGVGFLGTAVIIVIVFAIINIGKTSSPSNQQLSPLPTLGTDDNTLSSRLLPASTQDRSKFGDLQYKPGDFVSTEETEDESVKIRIENQSQPKE